MVTEEEGTRLARLEERLTGVERAVLEMGQLIRELTKEIREGYVPRSECAVQSGRHDDRVLRLESRMRDAEAEQRRQAEQLNSVRAAPVREPGWTKLLLALVSILGGALITLIVSLAIM